MSCVNCGKELTGKDRDMIKTAKQQVIPTGDEQVIYFEQGVVQLTPKGVVDGRMLVLIFFRANPDGTGPIETRPRVTIPFQNIPPGSPVLAYLAARDAAVGTLVGALGA